MKYNYTFYLSLLLFIIAGIIADQVTKHWILSHLYFGENLELLPFLNITHVHNYGVSFGWLSKLGIPPLVFAIGVGSIVCGLIALMIKTPSKIFAIALACMISGALGNMIDRITHGYVIDFMSVHWFGKYYFHVFNGADILVTTGAILIILDGIITTKDKST